MTDVVNHPPHYTSHPSGVECIQITEHMGFNLGNALKYIWRADEKGSALEDLRKAAWYIQRELDKRDRRTCAHCGDSIVRHDGNGGQWIGAIPPRDWVTCSGVVDGTKHTPTSSAGAQS